MRLSVFLAACLLSVQPVFANELACFSKYFNRGEYPVRLSADIQSETNLQDLEITVSGEVIRKGKNVPGRNWSGRKYKDMVVFDLDAPDIQGGGGWENSNMSLMLPQGFSEMSIGQRFKGIITESASDGGTYNEVLCRIK